MGHDAQWKTEEQKTGAEWLLRACCFLNIALLLRDE
jgi:hypothetical protein